MIAWLQLSGRRSAACSTSRAAGSPEYQRRLELSREPAGRDEIGLLDGQVRRLRQGISRLIDSYAEGLIEKPEFEPRVKRLKERVTAVEHQLDQMRASVVEHRDLYLVLGHLEDFDEYRRKYAGWRVEESGSESLKISKPHHTM